MHFGWDAGSGDRTVVSIWDSGGMSVVEQPEWAGEVVSIAEFQGVLIVACQRAVFRMRDGTLYPIRFSDA